MERETGFEPATSTLARSHSTTELFPPSATFKIPTGTAFVKPGALLAAPQFSLRLWGWSGPLGYEGRRRISQAMG